MTDLEVSLGQKARNLGGIGKVYGETRVHGASNARALRETGGAHGQAPRVMSSVSMRVSRKVTQRRSSSATCR